jgi:ubiquinone biosynthesis protein
VRDGFGFIGARLSPSRLVPKLVEQLALPSSASPEERVLTFIRRIPVLQKIGQTLARDVNLDPDLRARLIVLEDEIREVEEPEIRTAIEKQLGDLLSRYQVELLPGLYGEGSVSALLRFTSSNFAALGIRNGVFKVLKPYIAEFFKEDLTLFAELANYFDANQKRYHLAEVNLRAIVDDVRELYEREIDFVNERRNLVTAAEQLARKPGVRVPRPLDLLSTGTISAMSDEHSVKITEAFPDDRIRRRELARKLIESLVARPLFSAEQVSLFHADPHAGNLRVNEGTGDLVLLDWALTGSLSTADRRSLILLFSALPLRDEGQILTALSDLSLSKDEGARAETKRLVESFIDELPLGAIPSSKSLSELLNNLLRAGILFSGSFLIFRKMLSTLEDVVDCFSPGEDFQRVVVEYAVKNGLLKTFGRGVWKPDFKVPLDGGDYFRVGLSAQSFVPRVWIQTVRSVTRNAGAFVSGSPKSATGA